MGARPGSVTAAVERTRQHRANSLLNSHPGCYSGAAAGGPRPIPEVSCLTTAPQGKRIRSQAAEHERTPIYNLLAVGAPG
jgi:hypothetical protein